MKALSGGRQHRIFWPMLGDDEETETKLDIFMLLVQENREVLRGTEEVLYTVLNYLREVWLICLRISGLFSNNYCQPRAPFAALLVRTAVRNLSFFMLDIIRLRLDNSILSADWQQFASNHNLAPRRPVKS
jgi:hypothetical protein